MFGTVASHMGLSTQSLSVSYEFALVAMAIALGFQVNQERFNEDKPFILNESPSSSAVSLSTILLP